MAMLWLRITSRSSPTSSEGGGLLTVDNAASPLSAALMGLIILFSCLGPALSQQPPQSLDKLVDFHTKFTRLAYGTVDEGALSIDDKSLSSSCGLKGGQSLISVSEEKQRSAELGGLLKGSRSMNIDVSRITVVAINVAEGGKAVATSDILINPVQIIEAVGGSEVLEKLK